MTNEELIQAFPECDKIKREDMRKCIIDVIEQEKSYREAIRKVHKKALELFPAYFGPYNKEDPEQNAYRAYFWGDSGNCPFDQWLDKLEEEFIARHGQQHTFDEACQLAADEWVKMIFGNQGGLAMVLGTLVKVKAKDVYDAEVIENFRTLIKQYYLGRCMLKYEDGYEYLDVPSCDDQPSRVLLDILVKAGVKERIANIICPWKTCIYIDERDNSVVVCGYQRERYL